MFTFIFRDCLFFNYYFLKQKLVILYLKIFFDFFDFFRIVFYVFRDNVLFSFQFFVFQISYNVYCWKFLEGGIVLLGFFFFVVKGIINISLGIFNVRIFLVYIGYFSFFCIDKLCCDVRINKGNVFFLNFVWFGF